MQPAVFIVEPQTLFVPKLVSVVAAAGGTTIRVVPKVDIEEIVSLKADFALLDLDYTAQCPLDGLAYVRGAAPHISCIMLTADHGPEPTRRLMRGGAKAILSKAVGEEDTIRSLSELFGAWSISEAVEWRRGPRGGLRRQAGV